MVHPRLGFLVRDKESISGARESSGTVWSRKRFKGTLNLRRSARSPIYHGIRVNTAIATAGWPVLVTNGACAAPCCGAHPSSEGRDGNPIAGGVRLKNSTVRHGLDSKIHLYPRYRLTDGAGVGQRVGNVARVPRLRASATSLRT